MKKAAILILLIVLLCTMISATIADGLLPELEDFYGVSMPSLFDTLKRSPDDQTTLQDESVQEIWYAVTDENYTEFGNYLSRSGCDMVSYSVEGSVFNAEVAKDGKSFFFSYDSEQKCAILVYPQGTYDGGLDKAEHLYQQALTSYEEGDVISARYAFYKVGKGYKDSNAFLKMIDKTVENKLVLDGMPVYGIRQDGSVLTSTIEEDEYGTSKAQKWKDILCISATRYHTVGLKNDGTVVAVGTNKAGACNVNNWKDIIEVCAGGDVVDDELDRTFTVGLKADGTVVSTGNNEYGQCNTSDWEDIVSIQTGTSDYGSDGVHLATIGLKADGTVITTDEELNHAVTDWRDIISIYVGKYGFGSIVIVGLKSDGTVVSTKWDTSKWTDIEKIAVGVYHMIGIKKNGRLVCTVKGDESHPQGHVTGWGDIVQVAAGERHSVALKADGTVLATGDNLFGQCNVKTWKDIVAVYADYSKTYGIKADGSVLSTYDRDQLEGWDLLDEWNSIVNTDPDSSFEATIEVDDNQYRTLKKGSKGDAVIMLQNALIEAGVLSGKADGDFGRMTEEAVKQMQTEYGMEATGIADVEFQNKLFGE